MGPPNGGTTGTGINAASTPPAEKGAAEPMIPQISAPVYLSAPVILFPEFPGSVRRRQDVLRWQRRRWGKLRIRRPDRQYHDAEFAVPFSPCQLSATMRSCQRIPDD
jgi:hypothetical protein